MTKIFGQQYFLDEYYHKACEEHHLLEGKILRRASGPELEAWWEEEAFRQTFSSELLGQHIFIEHIPSELFYHKQFVKICHLTNVVKYVRLKKFVK